MEETAVNSKILEISGESALAVRPELEQVGTAEKDSRGVGYLMNWVSLILLFVISMIAIAWFGPFSEV